MLESGADLQLGPYEFMVDRTIGSSNSLIRPHYLHTYTQLTQSRTDITGKPGTSNLDPQIMLYVFDDFSGGEGLLSYDESRPSVFDYGQINPRNPGYFTTPPAGTITTVSATTAPGRVFLFTAYGALWAAGGTEPNHFVKYSTDGGLTWTSVTCTLTAGYTITAATGGQGYVYIEGTQTPGGVGGGIIQRVNSDGDDTLLVDGSGGSSTDVPLGPNGLAYIGPWLARWTGQNLSLYDTTTTALPMTGGTLTFNSGLQNFPSTGYNGGIVATDNALAMFYSAPGADTQVYEFIGGIGGYGTPVWGGSSLAGFTATCIGYSSGILYLAGTYNHRAMLYGMDWASQTPVRIGEIRKDQNLTLTPYSIKTGYGSQVLIGCKEGYVFVYDAETDAISELAENTSYTQLLDVATYKDKRVSLFKDTGGTTTKTISYGLDDGTADSGGPFTVVFPAWDMDLPTQSNKVLIDLTAQTDGLSNTNTIEAQYQLEENGVWISLGVRRSGVLATWTVSSNEGTVKFNIIRFRLVIHGNPKVYRWTMRAIDSAYIEMWEIVIKVADEQQGSALKPQGREERGFVIYQWLKSLKEAGALVTFKDGFPYPEPTLSPGYDTHTVFVNDVQHIVYDVGKKHSGEGVWRLTLRSLAAS